MWNSAWDICQFYLNHSFADHFCSLKLVGCFHCFFPSFVSFFFFFAVTVSFCAFQGLYGIDLVHVDPLLVIIYTVDNDFRIKIVGYSSFEWNNTTTQTSNSFLHPTADTVAQKSDDNTTFKSMRNFNLCYTFEQITKTGTFKNTYTFLFPECLRIDDCCFFYTYSKIFFLSFQNKKKYLWRTLSFSR